MSAAHEVAAAAPLLFSDQGCPFAHRVLALLDHLGCEHESRRARVGRKPDGIERYSGRGSTPLLVHGDLVITESRVMLEHLAEHYLMQDALPSALPERTLHRQAMAVVDKTLAPAFTGPDPSPGHLVEALDSLEAAAALAPPRPELLALHVAPMWLRLQWWRAGSATTAAVRARPALRAWLDAAAGLACVRRTTPDAAERRAAVADARAAGLTLPVD